MNPNYCWIDCPSWELDFFGLPHRIPWPANVDPQVATQSPFELAHLQDALDAMGSDLEEPWRGFKLASAHFNDLTEAIEDSEIRRAHELLAEIERVHPGTSFRIFHEAYVARHEGRLDAAIELYQQAVEKTPGISEIWNNLAIVLAMSERREEAVAAFRKALEISPQDRGALEGLAQLRVLVKLLRDANKPESATYVELDTFREMATQQIERLAAEPDQLIAYGEELLRAGLVPEVGLKAVLHALELRPDHPRYLFAAANAHRVFGQLPEARAVLTRLTEVLPDNPEAFYHLAQICNAMEDREAERAALKRSIDLNPNVQTPLGIWFELRAGEHSPEKEEEILAFAEERKSWMAFILASAICRDRGDIARALRWAERAMAIEPSAEDTVLHLTSIIGDARDVTKLATVIKPLVESGKFSPRLVWNYAHVLRQLGLNSDAIAVLRKAAAADGPEDFKAACATTIEAWSGLLTGGGVQLEVHRSGVLLRDVLLSLEDDDGGVILNAGAQLPSQGTFPWRASGPETSVSLQQGHSGTANEPRNLGDFKVRGIQITPGQPTTIECHLTALPDGALHFRAAQNGKRLTVGWAPPKSHLA